MVVATYIEMGETKPWICFQPFYACSYHVLIGFVKVSKIVCTHPTSATLDWLWTKLSLVWVCECELMMWLHVEGRVSRLYSCLLLDVHICWKGWADHMWVRNPEHWHYFHSISDIRSTVFVPRVHLLFTVKTFWVVTSISTSNSSCILKNASSRRWCFCHVLKRSWV